MIRRLCLLFLLLIAPLPALAAAIFTATVENPHVMAWEGVTLQLTLTGAKPQGNPDTAALAQVFDIVGQGHSSKTSFVNGVMSSNTGWQLTLMPKHDGRLILPPVSIDTDAGRLTTKPIELEIGEPGAPTSPSTNGGQAGTAAPAHINSPPLTISAAVSQADPYQNQPVLYTIKVLARASIADVGLGDVTADNAIVQPQGQPTVSDGTDRGEPVKVIEFHYLVTPLQAQTLTINPVTMQGNVETRNTAPPAGLGNGFMDPFAMLQAMNAGVMPGFPRMRPFSITANAVKLTVKPPVAAMEPWLPLKALRIDETIEPHQPVKVGEPLTRKFTLTADGMGGAQLPSLEPQQAATDLKVYADKPVTDETVNKTTGDVMGRRVESYSLIPLTAGRLTLPAVRLAWWDIRAGHVAYAEAPARTVEVLPGSPTASPPPATPTPQPAAQPASPPAAYLTTPAALLAALPTNDLSKVPARRFWLEIGGIAMVLIASLGLLVWRQRHRRGAAPTGDQIAADSTPAIFAPRASPVATPRWDAITTVPELNAALQAYAQERWHAPPHAAVEISWAPAVAHLPPAERADFTALIGDLNGALYGGKTVELERMKAIAQRLFAGLHGSRRPTPPTRGDLPDLNPT